MQTNAYILGTTGSKLRGSLLFASSGQMFVPLSIVPLIYSHILATIQKLIKVKIHQQCNKMQ